MEEKFYDFFEIDYSERFDQLKIIYKKLNIDDWLLFNNFLDTFKIIRCSFVKENLIKVLS